MEGQKSTILVVEDDLDIADMLSAYFRVQGYDVVAVNWGEDGLEQCQTQHPDLVILDIHLPDLDGFEIARRLRSNRRTQNIPIIFLTEKRERTDRLKGLELQADDYITKPFDIQELRLRVRNALQRAKRGTLTNPITGVAEGSLVDERLNQCLHDSVWALMAISLKNLDRFRDIYGFVASDDLLRAVTLMIQDSIKALGTADDFLGHLTTTDFVVVTRTDRLSDLKARISTRLKQSFDYFYRDQDRDSDVFRGRHLNVQIGDLLVQPGGFHDLQHLKTTLEQLYRQEHS